MSSEHGRRKMLATLGSMAASLLVLRSPAAHAAVRGRFRLTRRTITETDEGWRAMMTIALQTPPPSGSVPFRFELRLHAEVVHDEDGRETKRRVQPPELITEQQDVSFADPQGRIGTTARAELMLTRARGYKPGDWSLELHGPDGQVGARAELSLRAGGAQ